MLTIPKEQYRRFGSTGLRVSALGFGGAPIGVLETEQDEVSRVLSMLLDHGVNVIDTAAMYRGSEAMIGRTLADRRDQFILISKCGHEIEESDAPAWSPELIRASVERSLKRLKTDVIDVMLLHSCDLATLQKGEALGELIRLREAGMVRLAGYSGDNEAAAWAVQQPDVRVLQTSINICDQRNIEQVLPAARKHEVGVMVKRPIANAAWKTVHEQYAGYRDYARPYHERFREMDMRLEDLGIDAGAKTDAAALWPEIALRFVLSVAGVHTAIIGTTKPSHVEANLQAAAKGPLPEEVVDRLCQAFRNAPGSTGWEGLT